MTVRMQQRRGTAAQWTSANPVLGQGELGVETDTLKLKMGNGTTAWNSLSYVLANTNDVGTNAIQNGAVTNAKLGADSVTTDKILNGTIVDADINANAAIAQSKVSGLPDALALKADKATVGNLLTDNQASGTDAEGATTGFLAKSNCTIARSTAQAYQGSGSLLVTQTSGTYYMGAAYAAAPLLGLAGQIVTLQAHVRAGAASSTTAQILLATNLGNYDGNPPTAISTGSWTKVSYTLTVPAGITSCEFAVLVGDASGSGTYYLDGLSIHRGAGGIFATPGLPTVGQSRIAVNNAMDLSGTGDPNWVITAAPGSTWLQTDATTDVKGWIRWVKATGTGNTGWVAGPEADTGWRDVTASLDSTFKTKRPNALVHLRRRGDICEVRFIDSGTPQAVGGLIYELPNGFWGNDSAKAATVMLNADTVAGTTASMLITYAGGQWLYCAEWSTVPYVGSLAWMTTRGWPASLPGTPA